MYREYTYRQPVSPVKFWLSYFTVLALFAFLLMGCSNDTSYTLPPAPPQPTVYAPGNAAWALVPGTYVEYVQYVGVGHYDPVTDMIAIDESTVVKQYPFRVTNLVGTLPYPGAPPAVLRTIGPPGEVVTGMTQYGGWYQSSTATFVGESTLQVPPEPLVTNNPVAGEVFYVTSQVLFENGAPNGSVITRYRTQAVGQVINGHPNAVQTTLVERPGTPGQRAYVYVFSGGEQVETWFGDVAPDNTVQLIIWRSTAVGGPGP